MKLWHGKAVAIICSALGGIFLLWFLWPLPRGFTEPVQMPVKILDRSGRLLYEVRAPDSGAQEHVALRELPPFLLQTLIATEDRTFYSHPGVSLRGIVRAAWQNAQAGRIVSGGSTITQQFVRVARGGRSRGILPKLWEMALALKVDAHLSKDAILEGYLNGTYFGNQAYGVAAAARTYFSKNIGELSRAEITFLVGLLQAPSRFDPFENFPAAKERQKRVIAALVSQCVTLSPDPSSKLRINSVRHIALCHGSSELTMTQAKELEDEELVVHTPRVPIEAPHFVMWLLHDDRVETPYYGVSTDASEIRTTLDLPLQWEVQRIVERNVARLAEKRVTSAAVVVLDAHNGDILAMIGSADYFDTEHDGAVNVAVSPRQPGSALKPFTYALALRAGDTAATTVADVETQYFTQEGNPYVPRNYDYDLHGLVRYREALANSYNIAAVRVLEKVGVETLLKFLRAAGITTLTQSPEHYGVALTLGSGEVSLLELTRAYGIFPRGGRTLHERAFLTDPVRPGTDILDHGISWIITDILADPSARIPEFGTEGPLNFDFPVAAKTGTTRNSRDNWVVGFTPDILVGVWVGNADNSPMRDTSGITGAGPIFHEVMEAAEKTSGLFSGKRDLRSFPQPEGFSRISICSVSGKLPTGACPQTMDEWFIRGTEPKEPDDIFHTLTIDRRNGLLASDNCPAGVREDRVFAHFPSELQKWAREKGWKEAPTAKSPLCGPCHGELCRTMALPVSPFVSAQGDTVTITRPRAGDSFQLDPLVPNVSEQVIFEARTENPVTSVQWLLDGVLLGTGKAPDFRFMWRPTVGIHTLEVRAGEASDRVQFEVVR